LRRSVLIAAGSLVAAVGRIKSLFANRGALSAARFSARKDAGKRANPKITRTLRIISETRIRCIRGPRRRTGSWSDENRARDRNRKFLRPARTRTDGSNSFRIRTVRVAGAQLRVYSYLVFESIIGHLGVFTGH